MVEFKSPFRSGSYPKPDNTKESGVGCVISTGLSVEKNSYFVDPSSNVTI